jgi:hypothetical protein
VRRLVQLFATIVVVAGLAVIPAVAGPVAPMGVVTGSQGAANVGRVAALDGTSIYDGDILTTGVNGALRIRIGDGQLLLAGNTAVTIHKTEAGVTATLTAGTVRFAIVPGSSFDVRTLNVVDVNTKDGKPANGTLSIVSPTSFQVGSSKGDLNVSVNGIDSTVAESKTYQVNLDDDAQSGGSGGSPHGAGKSKGLWLIIGAIAAGTAVGLIFAFQSPSKP